MKLKVITSNSQGKSTMVDLLQDDTNMPTNATWVSNPTSLSMLQSGLKLLASMISPNDQTTWRLHTATLWMGI